ncbi:MAG: hypothetical protein LAO09_19310 [Acidobacteriia bacterium]|nr:hypothetical protein [Terriglobia bacterium]
MNAGIDFAELLAYTADETQRWKEWFTKNPSALDLPIDIADAGTVRRLVKHIFFVELHFSNMLLGIPPADFESLPASTLVELFRISEEANDRYQKFLATARAEDWEAKVDLGPRLSLKPSKRKCMAQALTHSMRHWAQISTFLRQQGLKQDWNHDFLLSKAME